MIGAKIRYFRQMKGITQEQLASGICSIPYLSKIEHGLAQPSEELVGHLCKELGVSLDQVDDEDKMNKLHNDLDSWYKEMRLRNFDEVVSYKKLIDEEIDGVEDPDMLTKYLLLSFRYHILFRETDKANDILERLYHVQERLSEQLEFYYFYFLGLYYYQNSKFKEAGEQYKKAHFLLTSMKSNSAEWAEFYYQQALVHNRLSQITLSNNLAIKCLEMFNKEYNFKRASDTEILLGVNNRVILNYGEAEHHFQNAQKYAESFNDKRLKSIIYHDLGYVYSCQNESDMALKYYQLALQNSEVHEIEDRAKTLYLIASEYIESGNFDLARKSIDDGMELVTKTEYLEYIHHFKILILKLSSKQSENQEVILKDAVEYFEEKTRWYYVSEYGEMLADHYFNNGQYKNSSFYFRLANDARKKIMN
ncbi:helix-turn-helix domain-containing protein [Bacillus hwajinpoensis]|uniref:Helix-turn-helix domain-containing protein n=1 Tax=Guptibacillus hwajinpoensis TaxID=208199 RepID=A0A845ETX8_9BACL|nr:helix-turn-helix domain-containing protein [Pseudalkalibacillus hwajinpoensis]MYL61986.1 helix-turn-helix domain-containing protein [Pseudalkalibacillus hwajinpoensis]